MSSACQKNTTFCQKYHNTYHLALNKINNEYLNLTSVPKLDERVMKIMNVQARYLHTMAATSTAAVDELQSALPPGVSTAVGTSSDDSHPIVTVTCPSG